MMEIIKKVNPALLIAFFVGILFVAVFLFLAFGRKVEKQKIAQTTKVQVETENGLLTVASDGMVQFDTKDGVYSDQWGEDKTNAFFSYMQDNYYNSSEMVGSVKIVFYDSGGSSHTVYTSGGEEFLDVVIDDVTSSPTPTPLPTSTPKQGATPTPTPASGGQTECLYWRLSYCVRFNTPTPTPTSTAESVDLPPECGANLQTGRTVISNELCIPESEQE